ncbi:hypothetical protein WHR41_01325 [Cladosporium halotolerans]|uniref:Fe2OG dioxygenase domain-containing protein n=1 Tax=Cladosporium halotolerans TaxID=1052096 RepID=A0AB34L1Z0_9PEZI
MASSNASIPIIDISPSNPDAPQQLLSAASKYGFVFVENNAATGIPPQDIAKMFEISKEFFAAPVEVKQTAAIASNEAGKNLGWLSRGVEKLDPGTQKRADVKEAFNLAPPSSPTNAPTQPLPSPLAPHAPLLTTFQTSCQTLCQTLLSHLSAALATPPDWFTSRHDASLGPTGSIFRMLYYPALSPEETQKAENEGEELDLRAGAHSDFGSLTLLFRLPGQPGLEIRTAEGKWEGVGFGDSAGEEGGLLPILVNIGDLLEDWTCGLLKSTVHRVVFPRGSAPADRYSLAYFCHPLDEAALEAVPSEDVRAHARERGLGGGGGRAGMTAREHLMERLGATYSVGK